MWKSWIVQICAGWCCVVGVVAEYLYIIYCLTLVYPHAILSTLEGTPTRSSGKSPMGVSSSSRPTRTLSSPLPPLPPQLPPRHHHYSHHQYRRRPPTPLSLLSAMERSTPPRAPHHTLGHGGSAPGTRSSGREGSPFWWITVFLMAPR